MTSNPIGDLLSGNSGLPAQQVRDELNRILDSPDFRSTARRRKLLKYLVEELLAGRDKGFKGYTIATVVFGRDDTFDPQSDPVVRLEARRLRHDLDGYYVSAGRDNDLRITIPKGHYAPVVEWAHRGIGDDTEPEAASEGNSHGAQLLWFRTAVPGRTLALKSALVATVMLAVVLVLVVGLPVFSDRQSDLDGGHGPALAVLPFSTYGATPSQAILGQGIADEVLTGLSRFPDLRLYLSEGGTDTAGTPIEVGERLGLTYVLDGSIQSVFESDTLRISARLTEVKTRRIVWIGKYERTYARGSLLAVRDDIANSVASALGQPYGIIRTDETKDFSGSAPPSSTSYECVLRTYGYRHSLSADAYKPALACLEQAVKQDPEYAEAWALLGWLQMDAGRFGWTADGDNSAAYKKGLDTALHANALDRDNITSLKALSSIYHYLGNFSESERLQRRALALNPNDPDTLAQLGWRLAVRGNFDEGIPLLKQAIDRTVNPPGWYYHLIAIDQYLHGRYEEMLQTAKASTTDGSGMSWSFVAIAEGALKDDAGAKLALGNMVDTSPRLARDPAAVYRRAQATDKIVNALVNGLRVAGWKEPAEATGVP